MSFYNIKICLGKFLLIFAKKQFEFVMDGDFALTVESNQNPVDSSYFKEECIVDIFNDDSEIQSTESIDNVISSLLNQKEETTSLSSLDYRLSRMEACISEVFQMMSTMCKVLDIPISPAVFQSNHMGDIINEQVETSIATESKNFISINTDFSKFSNCVDALVNQEASFFAMANFYYKKVTREFEAVCSKRGFLFTPKKPYAQSLVARAVIFILRPNVFICQQWPTPRRQFSNLKELNFFMCKYKDIIHHFFLFCLTGKINGTCQPKSEEELKKPHQKKFMLKQWSTVFMF